MNKDRISPEIDRIVKIISGVGSLTSATIGAKTVVNLARMLQMPIVVVEKTIGNRSMCPMYKFPKVAAVPKFITNRQAGTA